MWKAPALLKGLWQLSYLVLCAIVGIIKKVSGVEDKDFASSPSQKVCLSIDTGNSLSKILRLNLRTADHLNPIVIAYLHQVHKASKTPTRKEQLRIVHKLKTLHKRLSKTGEAIFLNQLTSIRKKNLLAEITTRSFTLN